MSQAEETTPTKGTQSEDIEMIDVDVTPEKKPFFVRGESHDHRETGTKRKASSPLTDLRPNLESSVLNVKPEPVQSDEGSGFKLKIKVRLVGM